MFDFNLSTVVSILHKARKEGITVSCEGNDLVVKISKGQKFNTVLLDELKRSKADIVKYFKNCSMEHSVYASLTKSAITMQEGFTAPVSFAQERLWLMAQMGEAENFHISSLSRLRGILNEEHLEKAFRVVIDRHEILRSVYIEEEGGLFQQVMAGDGWRLERVDAEGWTEREVKLEVERRKNLLFDLSCDYPIRVTVVHVSGCESVLAITIHHIACDAWSLQIIYAELREVYNSLLQGRKYVLEDVPVQYRGYARWQRDVMKGEDFQEKNIFWKEQLNGVVPANFPVERSGNKAGKGSCYTIEFDGDEFRAIRKYIHERHSVTLYIFLLSAYSVLISRWCGQEDILVGSPAVNRAHKDLEQTVGIFLNTLAIRSYPERKKRFDTYLNEVRDIVVKAFEDQDCRFEDIVREQLGGRDIGAGLFNVFFNLVNVESAVQHGMCGIEILSYEIEDVRAKFDLNVYAKEHEGKLYLNCVYRREVFGEEPIRYVFSEFKALVRQILGFPQRKIGEFDIFSQKSVTIRGNAVSRKNEFEYFEESEIDQSISDRFRTIAGKYPTKLAVWANGETVTYDDLDRKTNQIARYLLEEAAMVWSVKTGVNGSEQRLTALLFGHNIKMIYGMLGVLKSGSGYVPIDPDYPVLRIIEIIKHSGVRVIMTEDEYYSLAVEIAEEMEVSVQVVNVDCATEELDDSPSCARVSPGSISYILYTSGSTGKPKGVFQSHRNTLHFCRVYTNAIRISASDRLTGLSSYCSDASKMSLYGALLNGAALFLYDMKELGIEQLSDVIKTNEVTIYHSTPSVFRNFMSNLKDKMSIKSLSVIVLGGEKVLWNDVAKYKKYCADDCILVNGLGPTESTLALQYFIDKGTPLGKGSVPVGYAVDKASISIMKDEATPAGIYELGEIVYVNDHVALGYWRDEARTRKVFGWDEQAGKRCYRSGDLGRMLPDGMIEFRGRKDNQVKVNGYRIEIEEIEVVLCAHPAIVAAAVVPVGEDHDHLLAAYYVSDEDIGWEGIRGHLMKQLPHYMIPSVFVRQQVLPLTTTGKVDRTKLSGQPVKLKDHSSPPDSDLQRDLARIWGEVLTIDPSRISINDSFFALGGHSLLAVSAVSRINSALKVKMKVRDLFYQPTIKGFSTLINKQQLLSAPDPGMDGGFVEVDTVIEKQLAAIWKQLLHVDNIGVNDNFFELGGHSLLVIRLISAIRKKFHTQIKLVDIFKRATLSRLAQYIALQQQSQATATVASDEHLVLLSSVDNLPPLFLVPGSNGTCDGYFELAGEFGDAYSVYGFQMMGVFEGEQPFKDISQIAKYHNHLIKTVQPKGPYRLIGHSLGGHVGYEMARQLEQNGDVVEYLTILDISVTREQQKKNDRHPSQRVPGFVVKRLMTLYDTCAQPYPEWFSSLQHNLSGLTIDEMILKIKQYIHQETIYSSAPDLIDFALRLLNLELTNVSIRNVITPGINTRLIVAKAIDSDWDHEDQFLGWGNCSSNVEAVNIPGNHFSMISADSVRVLVNFLRK